MIEEELKEEPALLKKRKKPQRRASTANHTTIQDLEEKLQRVKNFMNEVSVRLMLGQLKK